MIWTTPGFLWGLLVPLAWAVLVATGFRWKRRVGAAIGDPAVIGRLSDPRSGRFQRVKALLTVAAGTLLVLALAGPRWGQSFQEVQRRGIDVIIAVDVSASMLAEDIKPNRLTQAKRELRLVIDGLEGDRVGLVAFAGAAFLQCPLTLDYGAARTLLDLIAPDLIPKPGTSLAEAIQKACDAFPAGTRKHKALVLLTDGEDHSGALEAAVSRAAEEGVRIFAIGFGSAQGEPIPLRDESGNVTGYKKDASGQTVVSKLDEASLRDMAAKTHGLYFPSTQGEVEVSKILDNIKNMEKKSLDSRVYGQTENHFRWPLGFALLLLLVEFLFPEVTGHFGRLFRGWRGILFVLPLVGGIPSPARAMGRWPTAAELGREVQKSPQDPEAQMKWGLGLYREGGYASAGEAFQKAQTGYVDVPHKSAAAYNAGNAYYRQGQWDKAIEKYKEALREVPSDPDAKHNLEMAQAAKKAAAAAQPKPGEGKEPQPAGAGASGDPRENSSAPGAELKPGDMSKEDADRLLQVIEQQEKEARKNSPKGNPKEPTGGIDW